MRKHKKRKNWATHDVVVKDGQGRIKKVISKKTLNRRPLTYSLHNI